MHRTISFWMVLLLLGFSVSAFVRAQSPEQGQRVEVNSISSGHESPHGEGSHQRPSLQERILRAQSQAPPVPTHLSRAFSSGEERSSASRTRPSQAVSQPITTSQPLQVDPTTTEQTYSTHSIESSRRESHSPSTGNGSWQPSVTHPTEEGSAASSGHNQNNLREENLIEGVSPNLQVTTTGPKTVVVGREANYVVAVTNDGHIDADNVAVEFRIPAGAELVSVSGSEGATRMEEEPEQDGIIRWDLGRLGAHRRASLTVVLIPRSPQPFDLAVAWASLPSTGTSRIEVLEPKLSVFLSGPTDILYGETSNYTVTVSNPGTGVTENIILTLPPNSTTAGAVNRQNIGSLPAGSRKTIEFEFVAPQEGTMPIHIAASAEGNLSAEESREVLVRRAQFELAMDGPAIKFAGTTANYRIALSNTGNADATGVTALTPLPTGATFINCEGGGEFNEVTGKIEWSIGSLRSGERRDLSFTCLLMNAGQNMVAFDASSSGGLSATDSFLTDVEALADIKLELLDPRGPIEVGEDSVYEIRVSNRGTKAADNIAVFAYFETGIEPISVQGGVAEINQDGGVIFRPISRLEAGQQIILHVTARASISGDLKFRAEVECSDPDTRLSSEESTRFYGSMPTHSDANGSARLQDNNYAPR